jgi:cysteine desulfurase/selenocysteine lyase
VWFDNAATTQKPQAVIDRLAHFYEPEEVGQALNRDGIAVRAGHHFAQPILRRLRLEATVRASLSLYNTCDEVDVSVAALHRLAADAGHTRA